MYLSAANGRLRPHENETTGAESNVGSEREEAAAALPAVVVAAVVLLELKRRLGALRQLVKALGLAGRGGTKQEGQW